VCLEEMDMVKSGLVAVQIGTACWLRLIFCGI
jgi:hypothetical protein